MGISDRNLVKLGSEHVFVVGIVAEDHYILYGTAQQFEHAIDSRPLVIMLNNGIVRFKINIAQFFREGQALSLLFCCGSVELVDHTEILRIKVGIDDIGCRLPARADLVVEGKVFCEDLLRVFTGGQNTDSVIHAVMVEPQRLLVIQRPVFNKLFVDHNAHAAVTDHVVKAVPVKKFPGLVVGAAGINGYKVACRAELLQSIQSRGHDQAGGTVCQGTVYIKKEILFTHFHFPHSSPSFFSGLPQISFVCSILQHGTHYTFLKIIKKVSNKRRMLLNRLHLRLFYSSSHYTRDFSRRIRAKKRNSFHRARLRGESCIMNYLLSGNIFL